MQTNEQISARIKELNDLFRQEGRGNGKLLITNGIKHRGVIFVQEILELVRLYDDFNPDNDPYAEHDFGVIDHRGVRVFWKIDYYDANCRYGSEQPNEPSKTTRVLTIMLASEY
jgi:hypothetical protein